MKLFYPTAVNTLNKCIASTNAAIYLSLGLVFFSSLTGNAQAVSGIVTDYNGYWKSAVGNINTIKPSNSHNVLSFSYNGTQYSTGVNDQLLYSHGETFVAGDFWSLPVSGFTGTVTSNTKVGLGELNDGVHNGAGVSPSAPLTSYLSDGIKGLDIGTCIANLPAGSLNFPIANIQPANIGDGIPDVLVTQIADPSGSSDKYAFLDVDGNIVGHSKDILFTNIPPLAQWTADFYEANNNPRNLTSGFTNTDRDMRLWAADLSDFGITAANYSQIKRFVVTLSGNSDVAFAAYNNRTFNIATILPVTLTDFSVIAENNKAEMGWKTASESNSSRFVIERSTDKQNFTAIGQIAAAGTSAATSYYAYTDQHPVNGINYYRLKMIDINGTTTYSNVVSATFNALSNPVTLYPNPATTQVFINHPAASGKEQLTVCNASGVTILTADITKSSSQTKLNVQSLARGIYYITWQNGTTRNSQSLVIR